MKASAKEFLASACRAALVSMVLLIQAHALSNLPESPDHTTGPVNQPSTLVAAAEQAYSENRFHEAVKLYSKAITIDPADSSVFTARGMTYEMVNQLEKDGTAMLANLLAALTLPPESRIAVQVEKSVEALMLYLAVLRAGHVYLPLNTAYQAAEIEYFIGNAEPAVVVCAGARTSAGSARSPSRPARRHVFTLDDDRSGTLLERAAYPERPARARARAPPTTWPPSSTPAAPPDAARARC